MGILSNVTDFIGGSLFKEIKEGVMAYFPPDLTPQQKADLELGLEKVAAEKQLQTAKLLNQAALALDKRIAEQEGTAKDLKTIPYIGGLVIFLRGCQRPVWGFGALYIDITWFSSTVAYSGRQELALVIINLLVLGFLFGERAVQNIMPLVLRWMESRKPN